MVNTVVAERGCCSPGLQQGMQAVGAASARKTSPLTEGLAQGHSQDSTWPGTEPPPARIAVRKRRGRRGGARSCRRPPGPVGTREGMFLPPPARPARAACRTLALQSATLGRVGGARCRGSKLLYSRQPSLCFCAQKGLKET